MVNFYRQFIFVSHYVLVSKKIPEYDVFSGFSHNQTSDLSPTRLSGVEDNVNSLFRKYTSPQRLNSRMLAKQKLQMKRQNISDGTFPELQLATSPVHEHTCHYCSAKVHLANCDVCGNGWMGSTKGSDTSYHFAATWQYIPIISHIPCSLLYKRLTYKS